VPTTSIDTFFACTLIVSVAILATVYAAGTLQTQISSMQDLNKRDYLQALADHIVLSPGDPPNWGSQALFPQSLGLSDSHSQLPFDLDADKVSRLSTLNDYELTYAQIARATRLTKIAFGISINPILSIRVEPVGNVTETDATTYTFTVRVEKDSQPIAAALHLYAVAPGYFDNATSSTSTDGIANVSIQIPNSSRGQALLVVFARANFDPRMTSLETYSFAHLSSEPLPNLTFLKLSPLNYSLNVTAKSPDVRFSNGFAFSYSYQSNLTATGNSTLEVPNLTENSPIALVVEGFNGTTPFIEWTAFPQLPREKGADFADSEVNVFQYIVTIRGTFYKLKISLGDLPK
jgi:hypothetical protein